MENPQKEHGHVDLANEIVEAFARFRISGQEMQCLWVVLRKTYGWQKKVDKISLSQFSNLTGMARPLVARAIKKLVSKQILDVIKTDNSNINSYWFIKHYSKWKVLSKKLGVICSDNKGVINLVQKVLSKQIHTKDNIQKTIIQKKNVYLPLFNELWLKYPNKDGKKDAIRHFNSTVKTEEDVKNIRIALNNYINSERVKKGFIKNGSAWFNNWCDWIEYKETKKGVSIHG